MIYEDSAVNLFLKKAWYNRAVSRSATERPVIGQRIAQARKRKGMTQKELAEALEVTPQAIGNWERKIPSIGSEVLARLAMILEVSADELLGLAEPKGSAPTGRAWRTFTEVSQLPQKQQAKVLDVVDGFLASKK